LAPNISSAQANDDNADDEQEFPEFSGWVHRAILPDWPRESFREEAARTETSAFSVNHAEKRDKR
jgi:hypothetical protein